MKRNKVLGLVMVVALISVVAFAGVKLTEPAFTLTMDVNPSIEIVSNRLDKVVEINPLNEEARQMLSSFEHKDRDLKKTIEDLADLMVLTGYISGGKDNLVMITVNDNNVNTDVVDKLNNAIAAYLENKQIEAVIVNQAIAEEFDGRTGKDLVAKRISELDDGLDYAQLSKLTLRELVEFSEARNIAPEKLFAKILGTKDAHNKVYSEFIGEAKAREIALGLINGEIVKIKLDDVYDDDDDNPEYEIEIVANGHKYEIEIDAYTGKVLEFEKDDDRAEKKDNQPSVSANTVKNAGNNNSASVNKKQVIGEARAKEIALSHANGKIVEFELDEDDGRLVYEIEIIGNGYEYEIELDAYTGEVLEFEKDRDDD